MMNRFFKTFSIALAAVILFSCDDITPPETPAPEDSAYTGTVRVDPGGDAEFTLDDAKVEITVAEDMQTVDIKLLKVRLAGRMPEMDITVPGVALAPKDGNSYSLTGDGIVPTVAGGAFPQYTISDFEGTLTLQQTRLSSSASPALSFSMVCMELPVTFTGYRSVE